MTEARAGDEAGRAHRSPPREDATAGVDENREGLQLVADLAASKAALETAFDNLDSTALRRPAPGEWSAWDIAYHVAQIEVWYLAKLCEASSSDPLAALDEFLAVWDLMRSRALGLASRLATERLDEQGALSGVPDWTPRRLVERMAAHDREHAEQVTAARRSAVTDG